VALHVRGRAPGSVCFHGTLKQQRLQVLPEWSKRLLYLDTFILLVQEKQNPPACFSALAFCTLGILVPELHRVFTFAHRTLFFQTVTIITFVTFLNFLTQCKFGNMPVVCRTENLPLFAF